MTTTNEIVRNVLTAQSEQPTKESPADIKTWAKWLRLEIVSPEIGRMVEASAQFLNAYRNGDSPRWLTLLGGTGVGKTHCAKKVLDGISRRINWHEFDYFPQVCYWPGMVQDLRGAKAGDGTWNLFREMRSWPVLLIDDIGAERDTTGFAGEQLNTLIGCRDGRWTIITSNLKLEQIAGIDPRIADRIIRGKNKFIELDCQSYSLTKL